MFKALLRNDLRAGCSGILLGFLISLVPLFGDGDFETAIFLSTFAPLFLLLQSFISGSERWTPFILFFCSFRCANIFFSPCEYSYQNDWFLIFSVTSLFTAKIMISGLFSSSYRYLRIQMLFISGWLLYIVSFYKGLGADSFLGLAGYWHGSIYDERLFFSFEMVLHSVLVLAFGLCFVFAIRKALYLFILKFIFIFSVFSLDVFSDLKVYENKDVKLYHDLKLEEAKYFSSLLSNIRDRFDLYREFNPNDRKLNIFLSKNQEQKKRAFGLASTQMTKPWKREIYLDETSLSWRILVHEMAHIESARLSKEILAIPGGLLINPFFLEGFAESFAGKYSERYSKEVFKFFKNQKDAEFDMSKLESPLYFWTLNPSLSYMLSAHYFRKRMDLNGVASVFKDYENQSLDQNLIKKIEKDAKELKIRKGKLKRIANLVAKKGYGFKRCIHCKLPPLTKNQVLKSVNPHYRVSLSKKKLDVKTMYIWGNPGHSIFYWNFDVLRRAELKRNMK